MDDKIAATCYSYWPIAKRDDTGRIVGFPHIITEPKKVETKEVENGQISNSGN